MTIIICNFMEKLGVLNNYKTLEHNIGNKFKKKLTVDSLGIGF